MNSFVLSRYWMWDHPPEYGWPPRSHTFKEKWPSSGSSHWMSPPRGGGLWPPCPLHSGMLTGLLLCKSCATSHSCCEPISINGSVISRRYCFALFLSCLLFWDNPWALGRGCDTEFILWLSTPDALSGCDILCEPPWDRDRVLINLRLASDSQCSWG